MRPFRPPAANATRAILIACVGLHLASILPGLAFHGWLVWNAGLVPARVTGAIIGIDGAVPPTLTFLSHQFVHGSLVHLAMNMVFLAWVGRQVEWLLGPGRMLLLFLVGGIVGGIAQLAAAPGSAVPIVGASGAISAVFATYALLFARSGDEPATLLGLRLSGETVRALRYAALWIGLQLLVGVAFNQPGMGGIAIWAHIGGFIAGLLYGVPLLRRVR